jgi:hypothetical protein
MSTSIVSTSHFVTHLLAATKDEHLPDSLFNLHRSLEDEHKQQRPTTRADHVFSLALRLSLLIHTGLVLRRYRHRRFPLQSSNVSRLLLCKSSSSSRVSPFWSLFDCSSRVSKITNIIKSTSTHVTTPSSNSKAFRKFTGNASKTDRLRSIPDVSVSSRSTGHRHRVHRCVHSRCCRSHNQKVYPTAGRSARKQSQLFMWIYTDEILFCARWSRSISAESRWPNVNDRR